MPQTSRNNNPLYYNSFINDYSTIMKNKSEENSNINTSNIRESLKHKNSGIIFFLFKLHLM